MALQILVNHYNEDRDTVRRFLSSLDMQTGVEFSVMILSDGGVRLSEDDLSGFKFPIEYAYKSHTGVCDTRNVMLDRATAEWVMLLDIDDYFSADGLSLLMEKSDGMDVVGSNYIAEGPHGESRVMERDMIRLHGKVLRRQYLVDNDIRFPDLEFSGDMAFLWLAYALTDRIAWVDTAFYTWAWNPSSVTRSNPYFHVACYGNTLMCYRVLGRELIKRGRRDLLANLVATLFGMMYVDATSPEWERYPKDLRDKADASIGECMAEFIDVYRRIPEKYRREKYEFMRKYKGGECAPFEGMMEWFEPGDVLIVGHGVVGTNLGAELGILNPRFCDKYKHESTHGHFRFAFICVDTPLVDGTLDTLEVWNAIRENDADIYVVKSTVPVGTTDKMREILGKRIVFCPEYYGSTPHANNYEFDFTILGGDKGDCVEVIQLLQRVYDGRHTFRMVDAKTAELAKLMENSWLATKVSFCNQFADIAESKGVCYEELRELFVLDPRVNPSHTFVNRSQPYWDSHCLNKDVPEAAHDAPLLQAVIDYNKGCRNR